MRPSLHTVEECRRRGARSDCRGSRTRTWRRGQPASDARGVAQARIVESQRLRSVSFQLFRSPPALCVPTLSLDRLPMVAFFRVERSRAEIGKTCSALRMLPDWRRGVGCVVRRARHVQDGGSTGHHGVAKWVRRYAGWLPMGCLVGEGDVLGKRRGAARTCDAMNRAGIRRTTWRPRSARTKAIMRERCMCVLRWRFCTKVQEWV